MRLYQDVDIYENAAIGFSNTFASNLTVAMSRNLIQKEHSSNNNP